MNGNVHTLSETDILLALLSNGDSSIGSLSHRLNREVSHVARVVSELEQQNFVKKYVGQDARVTMVALTVSGINQAMLSQLKSYLLLDEIEKQNVELNKFISDMFIGFKQRFKK